MEVELYEICGSSANAKARIIVEENHSYVPTWDSVGRRIDWFILVNKKIAGVIGVGSATYPPCKDILTKLGVSKEEYKGIFNTIANNWRFAL